MAAALVLEGHEGEGAGEGPTWSTEGHPVKLAWDGGGVRATKCVLCVLNGVLQMNKHVSQDGHWQIGLQLVHTFQQRLFYRSSRP